MLKKFVLNALSSFVGAWIAIVIFIIGGVFLIFGIIGSVATGEVAKLGKHSVMKIMLSGVIEEAESAKQFDYSILLNGKISKAQTLKTLLASLEKAKTNSNIEALYIECGGVSASPATLDALRNGIKDFKKSGKRVFAYGDQLSMGDYYVASVADALYLNPAGSLDLQGVSGTTMYYKELLDKLGVDVEVVRVGTFKSAVEPYISNEMSTPARLQLDTLYNDIWNYILGEIAKDRKVKASTINNLVNNYIFLDKATVAKENNLVDDCLYFREVAKLIADYVGKDMEDLNFVGPELVVGNEPYNPDSDRQIAVLYAVGEIGEYEGAGIDCHNLVPIIVSLAEDDNVKGMVLRVNSPGGSVFGSEQMGEALDYFKSKGKPLAVSMGDYAASGGYWISAGADIIYSDPLTITGSIGIFGMVPNVSKLVDKIGVHPQTVSTNPGVLFPSIFYPMTEAQHAALQKNIELGYEKFITRVAEGRHRNANYIKSIAEGRVWSGMQAQKLGLVDKLGGLNDAIEWVTDKADVKNANIVSYPYPESTFWDILTSSSISANAEIQSVIDKLTAQNVDQQLIRMAGWFLLQNKVQAREPYHLITL